MKPQTPKRNAPQKRVAREEQFPKTWRAVVGKHATWEVLKVRPKCVRLALFRKGWESSEELREFSEDLRKLGVPIQIRPPEFFERKYPGAQGLILFVEGAPGLDFEILKTKAHATVIVLDGIEDPHNLGAIVRTAWLMGVDAIYTSQDRSVGLTPSAHKVACGGIEHVPIIEVVNFSQIFEDLKKNGFWVFGLHQDSRQTIYNTPIPEKIVWVLGSEEKGMRSTTERLCDEKIGIPQVSSTASYNASVSMAIALAITSHSRVRAHPR